MRGIVIDGRIGWTGGFGIDDKWLGDGRTNGSWRETNVRFEGPAVRQLQAAFAAAWAEATGTLLSGRFALTAAEGETIAGLLYATPTTGSTAAERFVAMSIAGATRTLYVTNPYFLPDDNFTALLTDASQRGVDVRILTAGPRTDVKIVRLAGRARYQALLDAGVRIYEWQPSTLRAKTLVADGVGSTVGSMNCDNRSMTLNDESTLMVLDERIGGEMNAMFVDDLSQAEEITPERFRRRGGSSAFSNRRQTCSRASCDTVVAFAVHEEVAAIEPSAITLSVVCQRMLIEEPGTATVKGGGESHEEKASAESSEGKGRSPEGKRR